MSNDSSSRPLRRSRDDKMLAGVLGGIGHHYGLDPVKIRVVYALLTIFSGAFPGIIAYLVLWFIIPQEEA